MDSETRRAKAREIERMKRKTGGLDSMLSSFREKKLSDEKTKQRNSTSHLPMGHKRQSSGLQMKSMLKQWVRACISRPPYNVTISNLSKSWGDGMAFAALVHSLTAVGRRKEPFSWSSVLKATPLERLTWAFDAAKKNLGTDSLLDAEDTIGYQDQKSIMLYLSTIRSAVNASTGGSRSLGANSGGTLFPTKKTTKAKAKSIATASTSSFEKNKELDSLAKRAAALQLKVRESSSFSTTKISKTAKTVISGSTGRSMSRADRLRQMKKGSADKKKTETKQLTQPKNSAIVSNVNKPRPTLPAPKAPEAQTETKKTSFALKTTKTKKITTSTAPEALQMKLPSQTPPTLSRPSSLPSRPKSSAPLPGPTRRSSLSSGMNLKSIRKSNKRMSKRMSTSMVFNTTTMGATNTATSIAAESSSKRGQRKTLNSTVVRSSGNLSDLTGVTEDHQAAIFHPDNQRDWMSGWGWKIGKWSAMGKGLKKYRYFVLENTRLAYWKSDVERDGAKKTDSSKLATMGEHRNEVQLMSIEAIQTCYIVHMNSEKHGIHLLSNNRTYTMMLKTIALRDQWVASILEALARLGRPLLLSRISQRYDKMNYYHEIIKNHGDDDVDALMEEKQMNEGVGYGNPFSEVDEQLSLHEALRIKGTDHYYSNIKNKSIPIRPSSFINDENQSSCFITSKEENKTLSKLQNGCFQMYHDVNHLLRLSETIHGKIDEIGTPETTPNDGLLAMIQTIDASLLNLEKAWNESNVQAKLHTKSMRALYNSKIKESGWTPMKGGWLKKPDFKKCKTIEQWNDHRGLLKYQRRWFVLHGNNLFYYKSDPKTYKSTFGRKGLKPKGSIEMSNILIVRPSLAPKAPEFSIDIVMSTGEVYILGCETQQEQLAWGVHLTRAGKCKTDDIPEAFQGIM